MFIQTKILTFIKKYRKLAGVLIKLINNRYAPEEMLIAKTGFNKVLFNILRKENLVVRQNIMFKRILEIKIERDIPEIVPVYPYFVVNITPNNARSPMDKIDVYIGYSGLPIPKRIFTGE